MTPRWGRVWAWRAGALLPALVIATFVADGSVAAGLRVEAVMLIVATLVRPALGLMLVAFLAPLGDVVVPFLGAPPAHHAETLVIAFLAGWLSFLAGEDESAPRLPSSLVNAMWVFGGVLTASVAATALQLQSENAAELAHTLTVMTRSYLLTEDIIGAHTAAQLIEGLGLMSAAALVARSPRDKFWVRLSLIASGVVASVTSALIGLQVAPARTLARHAFVGLRRYSAVNGDVNAAASAYLLFLGLSAGVTTGVRRRRPWLLATGIILAGLAITWSAAAFLAAVLMLSAGAVLWIAFAVPGRLRIAAGLLLVILVAGGVVFSRTRRAAGSLEMRSGFNQASLHLIEARPVLGVGAGRYYPLSALVLPPRLSWLYGRENAHDYYLQTVAELGVLGAAVFLWLIAAALSAPLARVWTGRAGGAAVGCVAGVLAYLVTALTGHPFLVPEAATPFWIVLGLLIVPREASAVRSSWPRWTAIGVACALVLTVPLRDGVPRVRLPPSDDGFGPWRNDAAGRPFREAGSFSSLFVGPTVTAVEIPFRVAARGRARSAILTVSVRGLFGQELRIGPDWSSLIVPLSGAEALMPFQRINLEVTRTQGGPPPPGTAGADIGQVRLITVK